MRTFSERKPLKFRFDSRSSPFLRVVNLRNSVFATGALLSTLALATLASDAHAAGGKNPEFLWQPAANEISFAAQYAQTMDYEEKTESIGGASTITTKDSGTSIRGSLGFGLTDNIAIRAGTSSTESKSLTTSVITAESKRSGTGDIEAKVATSWGANYRLHVGVSGAFSPEKRKDPYSEFFGLPGTTGNQYSGGMSYAPYAGFSIPIAGSSWIGIVGTLETYLERKIEVAPGTDDTVTGGNVAQVLVFWEIPFRSMILDLAGGARTKDREKTTRAIGIVLENASYSVTVAQVDLKYLFSPSTFLGARYLMSIYPDRLISSEASTVKAVNVSELSLLLRFAF